LTVLVARGAVPVSSSSRQIGKINATRRVWHTDKDREELAAPQARKSKRLEKAGLIPINFRNSPCPKNPGRMGRNFE
jgi:hypothetical protein